MIFHRAEQTKAVLCCCVNTFVTSAVVVDGLLYIQMRCHCNEVVSQTGPKPVFRSIRRRWAGHWDNWSQLFGRRRLCQILMHLFKSASTQAGVAPGTKQLWEVKLTCCTSNSASICLSTALFIARAVRGWQVEL